MRNAPQNIHSMGLALLFIAYAIMGCGVNKGLKYDITIYLHEPSMI